MAPWVEVVVNFSTGEGFWCGHQLRVLAIVKLGKWILYVVHIRQSLHPVITGKSTDAQGIYTCCECLSVWRMSTRF